MKLNDAEQAMLNGDKGKASQKAMDFLVRYGGALSAVVTRVPTMSDFDRDPLAVIETGDWVKVDADKGVIEVTKKAGAKPATAAE